MVVVEVFIVGYYKIQTMSHQAVLQTMKMGRKKREDLYIWTQQWLSSLQVTRWGEYTQAGSNRQGSCLGPMGHNTTVMDTHSTEDLRVPHTFSVCYRDILENHIHITSSALIYSILQPSIPTPKRCILFPSFFLNKKKMFPDLIFWYCQNSCHN